VSVGLSTFPARLFEHTIALLYHLHCINDNVSFHLPVHRAVQQDRLEVTSCTCTVSTSNKL
jgi:hypothetical protein